MSLDGISGYNYNGYLWELDPKKTTTTNSAFNTQKPTIPQGYQTTPIGNMWGQPTSGIYAHSQYPTSLGQGSVFTQPTPLSNTAPAPAPIAAPVSNPAPKSVPTSGIYPTAKGAEYARMLGNNPLPAAPKPSPQTGLQPVRTWAKYAQEHGLAYQKPVKSGAVLADEIAAQRIAENQLKQTTTVAATREPYVAPSAKPVSITTIDEITAETQQPVEQAPTGETKAETEAKPNPKQKRVKTPEQRAAQIKRIKSNPRGAARLAKLKNASKLKVLKKAGKWGALAALVIGGGTLLYKACSNDKKDDTVKQEPETPKSSVPAKDEQTKPVETTTPAEPVESDEIGIGEFKDGKYKVKKGDNFWQIAEKNLIEEYKKAQKAKNEAIDENYKPTDAEILKETERLVGTNGYEFDEKHWNTTKPIFEGDILNIAA